MSRPRVTICKRGHDQTVEGARNASNACVACTRVRSEQRQAALPPKPMVIPNSIPESMIADLVRLQAISSQTIGATPIGHEFRRAGDLLAELAINAMHEYGVSVHKLSLQMGLTPSAMRFFLMRRGAIDITPGVRKNMGVYENKVTKGPSLATVCKRGHSYLEPGARDSWGKCRACSRYRSNRAYREKKAA